jgi:hypothetical protein
MRRKSREPRAAARAIRSTFVPCRDSPGRREQAFLTLLDARTGAGSIAFATRSCRASRRCKTPDGLPRRRPGDRSRGADAAIRPGRPGIRDADSNRARPRLLRPARLKGCTRRSLEPRQGRYRRARGASPEAGHRAKRQFFGPPRPPAPAGGPRGGGRPRMMRDRGNGLSRLTHSGLAPRALRYRPFGASRTPF